MSIIHRQGTTATAYADVFDIDNVDDIYDPIIVRVENTDGANSLTYRISTKIDRGSPYVIETAEAARAAGAFIDVIYNHVCAAIKVEVRSTTPGAHATYDVSVAGRRR